ncbi:uncharacterized protein LY79DRAFT_671281 [Colletotrichum navitas]|uniref:Uncharacterized protein n=1 Tax=Colletotrichum navitas TaxID=681940 RepID=A0AAD8PV39_9PEZI|nr:uncharacterized protein LY79DRAFT_671281 [Colletotrichum navitas]KAK1585191.1 hypothetical protein LY79DRAFT_671281 [Colletotrichum navitas]
MNHEKYEERLVLLSDVSPVDYDENLPFPYNNFIYGISLPGPATQDAFTNAIPYSEIRPMNEVTATYLAREGLARSKPEMVSMVPAIYTWQPAQPSSAIRDSILG